MGDKNCRSVRFSAEVDEKLVKFPRKLGRSKILMFCQMVDYFCRTGKDPLDVNDELLKKVFLKGHDTYMRFLKVQEKDLLIPSKEQVSRVFASQEQIVGLFNGYVIDSNKKVISLQKHQAEKFGELDSLVRAVYERMSDRERLKAQFLLILDGYVRERDQMNMATSGEKKRALAFSAKQQVELL